MLIGERLRALRAEKQLSQGDIEKRTGLLRCYVSRVENGHTIPAIETLEKMARALEVPMYQLLYEGEEPPLVPGLQQHNKWGASGRQARYLAKLCRALAAMRPDDRDLLLYMTQRMASRKRLPALSSSA
jgi:transcriptional regulator with XRE-family HTH domain